MTKYRESKRLAELRRQIALTRLKMQDLWEAKDYTDSEVLAVSIELDQLLNEYALSCPPEDPAAIFPRRSLYSPDLGSSAKK